MKLAKPHILIIMVALIAIALFIGTRYTKEGLKNSEDSNNLGSSFLGALMKLKSQDEAPAFAKQYGFVKENKPKENSPERLNLFINKKEQASIEMLEVNGLYISLSYKTYEEACAAATAMVKENLQAPESFQYKPYWPDQALLTSRWTGRGKQSYVSLACEQYNDKGASSVDIDINFDKLNASQK